VGTSAVLAVLYGPCTHGRPRQEHTDLTVVRDDGILVRAMQANPAFGPLTLTSMAPGTLVRSPPAVTLLDMSDAPQRTPRVALVTGASAGIGRATADLLAARGWTVVGASRRGTGGEGWTGRVMDVDSDESVRAGVRAVLADHGHVEAFVAGAGWGLAGPVETTTLQEARAQVETNFWGCVRVTTELLPSMRAHGAGRIVVVSSIGGLIAIPFQAYYSASKFALEGWAEATAYEVAPFGVHVTLVEPGNVRTDFTANRRRAAAAPGPYDLALRHAVEVMERDERDGADPMAVASAVARVLEAKHPRRRVSVGKVGERAGLVAKRALPHRWFEAAARSSLGVE
jgi:NAD(P)-dependent dehydrogenase (short-subunit alcohol dehydrogenase family)